VTGRYPQSHGVKTIVNQKTGVFMHPGERPLAMVLRDAGFQTALFGLQHESPDNSTLGFSVIESIQPRRTAPEVGMEAGEFIRATRSPFYLQVGFFETHTPYHFGGAEPDQTLGVSVPPFVIPNAAAVEWMAALQGSVRQADLGVAEILRALEESGQADDTLVIFTVDHGMELPRSKWFLYDPGVGVALICRWPNGGIAPGSRSDLLSSNVDLFPTILELLDLPIPEGVQGVSFAPVLRGRERIQIRDEIYAFQTGYEMRSIRTDRYKLICNFERHAPCTCPGDVAHPRQSSPVSPLVELYDLESDPLEFQNLADSPDHQEVRMTLTRKLRSWMEVQNDHILALTENSDAFLRAAVADLRLCV
jgi:arylsulfatase A-like enzyme